MNAYDALRSSCAIAETMSEGVLHEWEATKKQQHKLQLHRQYGFGPVCSQVISIYRISVAGITW
jgi:hypothetical protein